MTEVISSMFPTAPLAQFCTPETFSLMSSVASDVCRANSLISLATTAKPFPAAPARAASIVAFKARRLVCAEMPVMVSETLPMSRAALPSSSITPETVCSAILFGWTPSTGSLPHKVSAASRRDGRESRVWCQQRRPDTRTAPIARPAPFVVVASCAQLAAGGAGGVGCTSALGVREARWKNRSGQLRGKCSSAALRASVPYKDRRALLMSSISEVMDRTR
jgi:hypothetical protein